MRKGWLARVPRKVKGGLRLLGGQGRICFSQTGEDQILHFLFHTLGISHPTYIDIGANDPVAGSNTYFFYLRGARGVCIEPDPYLFQKIRKMRPKDICLQVGIGTQNETEADFFLYPPANSGWNTFSKEVADIRLAEGHRYKEILKIPLKEVNAIVREHLGAAPDLMSIDVEGMDFDILRTLDWAKCAPRVLVAETIALGDTAGAYKQTDLIDFVISKGYVIYADTYINTIFLRKDASAL